MSERVPTGESRRLLWGGVAVGVAVLAVFVATRAMRSRGSASATPMPISAHPDTSPPVPGQGPPGTMSVEERQRAYEARMAGLRVRVERTRAMVAAFPKELVDIDAASAKFPTPQSAFAFVREHIAFEPYAGVMKGANGTLASRGGNALDRAILLAAILRRHGVTARIAHGVLPRQAAEALLDEITRTAGALEHIAGLAGSLPSPPPVSDAQRAAADALQASVAGIARSRHAEALSSVTLVSAGLERDRTAPATASRERQIAALNQHYWVQASLDGQETDLDPSFSAAVPGQRFAEPSGTTFAADDLPDDLYQRLAIRVSADVLEDGAVTHRDVLTESARAADLLDKAIRLAVEPQALARAQNVYTVTIRMGDEPSRTVPLELRKAPAGGSAAAGLLGGLGGDEPAEPTRQNPAGAVLGRLVVDFVTTGPGLRPSRSRRVIVDRLEGEPASPRLVAGMEDDDSVRLLLAQIWDGAIGVGAIQPQQLVANHLQRLTSEQAEREQALADLYLGRRMSADAGGTPSVPAEVLGLFFYGGLTRHVLAVQGGALRVFQLRPRLAFHRRGAVVGDWSQPAGVGRMQESIDLINMPFDVVGDDRSDLKVKIGIADTALERSFARHSGDFNTVPLTAAAGEQKIAFATLTSTGAVDRLSVPPAIGNVMRDALEGGSTLIAPTALVRLNGIHTFGWWSLDPESGVPLGQMELGAGQAVSETAALNKAVLTGAHTFSKFYGGMLGCFYVEAADQLVPPDGPYHVTPTFNWSQGHIIPGLPTVASGQGLAACLVDRVCEAVVEYAFLAAESGAWMADLHDLQHLLVELLGLVGPTAVSNWIGACEGGEH